MRAGGNSAGHGQPRRAPPGEDDQADSERERDAVGFHVVPAPRKVDVGNARGGDAQSCVRTKTSKITKPTKITTIRLYRFRNFVIFVFFVIFVRGENECDDQTAKGMTER